MGVEILMPEVDELNHNDKIGNRLPHAADLSRSKSSSRRIDMENKTVRKVREKGLGSVQIDDNISDGKKQFSSFSERHERTSDFSSSRKSSDESDKVSTKSSIDPLLQEARSSNMSSVMLRSLLSKNSHLQADNRTKTVEPFKNRSWAKHEHGLPRPKLKVNDGNILPRNVFDKPKQLQNNGFSDVQHIINETSNIHHTNGDISEFHTPGQRSNEDHRLIHENESSLFNSFGNESSRFHHSDNKSSPSHLSQTDSSELQPQIRLRRFSSLTNGTIDVYPSPNEKSKLNSTDLTSGFHPHENADDVPSHYEVSDLPSSIETSDFPSPNNISAFSSFNETTVLPSNETSHTSDFPSPNETSEFHPLREISEFPTNGFSESDGLVDENDETEYDADYYYDQYLDYNSDDDQIERDVEYPVVYRDIDFSNQEVSVRLPFNMSGLQFQELSITPKAWNARDAFLEQVGFKLYMFLPAGVVGVILGIVLWILVISTLRIYGLFKRKVRKSLGWKIEDDCGEYVKEELELKRPESPTWKEIPDLEKVKTVSGGQTNLAYDEGGQGSPQPSAKSSSSGIGVSEKEEDDQDDLEGGDRTLYSKWVSGQPDSLHENNYRRNSD